MYFQMPIHKNEFNEVKQKLLYSESGEPTSDWLSQTAEIQWETERKRKCQKCDLDIKRVAERSKRTIIAFQNIGIVHIQSIKHESFGCRFVCYCLKTDWNVDATSAAAANAMIRFASRSLPIHSLVIVKFIFIFIWIFIRSAFVKSVAAILERRPRTTKCQTVHRTHWYQSMLLLFFFDSDQKKVRRESK